MMNVFQLTYDTRLQSWYELRKNLENADIETKCVEIDKWWQKAPLVNHHLHPDATDDWPNPWELLVDNTYCDVARGLGMIYTLVLLGTEDVDLLVGTDDNSEDVILVTVDCAKYVMNYWPDTVLNNTLKDFKIIKKIDLTEVIKKIR
jgi:hypothetical protein